MDDIQKRNDVDQAKARLEEVAKQKENRDVAAAQVNGQPIRADRPVPADKKEQRHIRPVSGKPKKKGFGEKMKEAFFGDIGDGTITEHILFRIFIPSVKRVLSDMANTAINMALGLDPKTRTISGSTNTHVANASTYRDRNYNRSQSGVAGYSRREAVSEFYWDEETAKDIYNQLNELIDTYGAATIEDAYSIMDMRDKIRSTDRNWGWTTMRNVEVYPVDSSNERWVVDMPPAKPV